MTIDPTAPRLTSLREQIFAAYNDIAHYVPHRASALFRKEVDALLSVPSPQPEWLPIETAPKGPEVLVFGINRMGKPTTAVCRWQFYRDTGWWVGFGSGNATHWMPLPSAATEAP